MPAVVQHLSGLVDSLDVASAGEMRVALDTPTPPDRISFAGPGKTPDELAQAVAAGVTVELESETEAARVAAAGERLGLRPQVAVRVNPDFQVKGSGMRLGGGPQQFGVDSERVPALLAELAGADLDVLGFHIFAGSQNLNAEILCEAQRNTVELALRLADAAAAPVRYLNIGGGFGIPYFERDRPLDLAAIGENLERLVTGVIGPALPDARVVVELGRYIVGEAGFYVTRVLDRKQSRGRTFLVVDGGLHHQLAASGNFGQVIRRNYPVAVAGRGDDGQNETRQRRGLPLHAARPAGRRRPAARRGHRRPGRGLPGRRVRADGEPDRLPQPSPAAGGAGVSETTTVDEVKGVVVETLGITDRADQIGPATPLLGALPELDSMAVLQLILALEEHFGITVEDEDVTAEAFETLERLTALVDASRP